MSKKTQKPESQRGRTPKLLYAVFVTAFLLAFCFLAFPPDRYVTMLEPGESDEPAFVVQVIRPRLGLPVAGLLPPSFFGIEETLVFDSKEKDTTLAFAPNQYLRLSTSRWRVHLILNEQSDISSDSYVDLEIVFENKLQLLRCRPNQPSNSVCVIETLNNGKAAGFVELELPHCENAETGTRIEWPPAPLLLRCSFDGVEVVTNNDRSQ